MYSRITASGSPMSRPSASTIEGRWLSPMPSRKRPPDSSMSVDASWAMMTGWRG